MPEPWHDLPLRLVTPGFLGRFDSDDQTQAIISFPIPSLRGVLAYWLRALAGAHVGNDIGRLHDIEAAVFGAAKTGTSGGPSSVQLRAGRLRLSVLDISNESNGLRYLMGPGLTAKSTPGKPQPPPRYLAPGQIDLRIRTLGSPSVNDLFLAALWALRTFGGIGARTRRGFGTVALPGPLEPPTQRFDPLWLSRDQIDDLGQVLACVAAAIDDLGPATGMDRATAFKDAPLYPCFAADSYRHGEDDQDQIRGTSADWRAALDNTGTWLWGFRHGADRRVPESQPPSGTHSQTYNDVVKPFLDNPAATRRTQNGPLTAAALGLPIPYSDHQGRPGADGRRAQRSATVEVQIDGQSARRASPLWLRVRYDGTAWRLRSLAFYNEWLPPEPTATLRIKTDRQSAPVNRPTIQQLHDELNRWFHARPQGKDVRS